MKRRERKFEVMNKLIENGWDFEELEMRDGEDVYEIVTGKKILYVYYFKDGIEVSIGENSGTVADPGIDPENIWELRTKDFKGKTEEEVIKKFNRIFNTKKYY